MTSTSLRLVITLLLGLPAMGFVRAEDAGSTPLPPTATPGKPISQEEAHRIAGRLLDKVCFPAEDLKSLKCEFRLNYIDLRPFYERMAAHGNWGELPQGLPLGQFDIMSFPFLPLVEPGLSAVRKGVFYWQKPEGEQQRVRERPCSAVLLCDESDNPLNVHPFVRFFLGMMCERYLLLGERSERWFLLIEPSDTRWEIHRLLDESPSDHNVLYEVFRALPQNGDTQASSPEDPWHRTCFAFDKNSAPLHVNREIWRDGEWTYDRARRRFAPLGATDRVGIVDVEGGDFAAQCEWGESDGLWLVKSAKGMRLDITSADLRKQEQVPWEVAFTHYEVNPAIPPGLLAAPEAPPIQMDFSTPEAAIKTVVTCLRQRRDLIPYCAVSPPDKPMPQHGSFGGDYYSDRIPGMKEKLTILESRQEGDAWIYTVQIPNSFTLGLRTTKFPIRIVPVGGEWRMDVDLGRLHLAFID